MSDFDGLRVCSVCGDRETTERVCWVCRQQEMLDAEPWLDEMEVDEKGIFQWSYGFFGGGDPRDFTPDEEMCTPEEIARWKADVALAEAGDATVAPPSGEWVFDQDGKPIMHILAPQYGMGTYKYRDQEDNANGRYIGPGSETLPTTGTGDDVVSQAAADAGTTGAGS